MRTISLGILLALSVFGVQSAHAEYKHQLLRKLAVFPIAGVQGSNAEEAWWQMREVLTQDQRFLVASRRFMINRGVFQARESLKPADVIILGRILDAQAVVTSFVIERRIHMNVYDAENGYLLWQNEMEFHPALPINDQIIKAGQKLMSDFVIALPYQGYIAVDPLREKPIFDEAGEKRAWVSMTKTKAVNVGDVIQIIEVAGDPSRIFFKDGSQTRAIAEGKVIEVQADRVLVKIEKVRSEADLTEYALVRFPKEVNQLRDIYRRDEKSASLSAEYLTAEMKTFDDLEKRHSSTTTSLAFIVSLAGMILLAF